MRGDGREERQGLGVDAGAAGHAGQAGVGRHAGVEVTVAAHGRVSLTPRLTEAHTGQHEGHRVLSSHHGARPDRGRVVTPPAGEAGVTRVSPAPAPGDQRAKCQDLNSDSSVTCSTNYVETYRESTEHHASDDDDLGEVLVSPLTDGHGIV